MSLGSYSLGSGSLGGLLEEESSVVIGSTLQLTIAGVDRTNLLLNDTLSITDELNSRNTCSFALADATKTMHLACGEVVRITYHGAYIFAGTVDEVEEHVPGEAAEVIIHNVRCVDWNQLMDRHIVANKWPADQSFYTVVSQILDTYSDINGGGETIANEGVTFSTATIENSPILNVIVANYVSAADLLDDLAGITGYAWNVDYNKVFYFADRTKFLAPYDLDDDVWLLYRNLRVRRSRDQYRNVQYLRAGKDETGARVNQFYGDGNPGKQSSFTLDLEVSSTPTIRKDIGAGFIAQAVGVREKDSGKDWYYEIGDDKITQDSSGTKLRNTDLLEVTYTGFFKIVQQGRNEEEIAARMAIEGGTGVYVDVESDENVDDADLAAAKVAGLLRKFGRVPVEVSFETDVDGFKAGQLLNVNLPEHGLSGQYLISNVDFGPVGDSFFRYQIKALDGEHLGGWVKFFKALAFVNRKAFAISENEKLLLLRQARDQFTLSDSMNTLDALQLYTLDATSFYIAGISRIGGRRQSSVNTSVFDDGPYYGPLVGTPSVIP